MPAQIVQKIQRYGQVVVLSDQEKRELCEIFGTKISFFDETTLPNFSVSDSELYQAIEKFHHGLKTTEFSKLSHQNYVRDFAVIVIQRLYLQIASSEQLLETKSIDIFGKPKTVVNFEKIKEFFADSWHVLVVLLISCGDVVTNEFTQSCRQNLRNSVMHGEIQFTDFMFETVRNLCELAKKEVTNTPTDSQNLPVIPWQKTVYSDKYISQILTTCGLMFGAATQKGPSSIVLNYLHP
jgi:hypothetical protein